MEDGLHARLDGVTADGCQPETVTALPVPDTVDVVPSLITPYSLATEMGTDELLVAFASVAVTTATIPFAIGVLFDPKARHMVDPVPVLHEMLLPAAVSAAPAVTLTAEISVGE